MKTKLFTLLLAVAASVGTMFAWDYERVQIGDLYYNLNATEKTAKVTCKSEGDENNYKGLTSANIPASVEYNSVAYSVTSIGEWAFYGCTGLTSVTIPNSVTNIGNLAFVGCTGLTSITIPNNVTSIGYVAFASCASLTSIIIPNSVTSIGQGAFSGCTSLTSIIIPNSVTSIGQSVFSGCTGLTSIEIPNSVTSIGENAFSGCSGLTSVIIGNSVTTIGNSAFNNCTNLTSVIWNAINCNSYNFGSQVTSFTFGDEVEVIPASLCSGMNQLTEIVIPNSVTSIGGQTFQNCTGLTGELVIPNSVTSIGEWAFEGCSGLTSVTIPNSVTTIGDYAFNGCTGLTFVDAPTSIFEAGESSWPNYTHILQNVTFNSGELTYNVLGILARSYKTLTSLDISGVTNTSLADEAFKGYYNITSLVLPEGLEYIGYMSVADCKNLQSIDIPASVVEISQSAFENCRSLTTINLGGSTNSAPGRFSAPASSASLLQRIGNWAFYNCHELQHLEIPEGVTEIGDGAFYGCTYLEDLSLPASVQSIGDNTFALCAKMKKIVVNATTPPSIQAKTFYDVKRQIPVYVPDDVVAQYENDPYWQEFDIQGVSQMPTGIEEVSSSLQDRGRLILHDGQILILRGEHIYTLTGQEVK